MKSLGFAQREEVKAWEQEFVPCEHTLGLVQEEGKKIPSHGKSKEEMGTGPRNIVNLIDRSWPMFNVRSQGEPLALFGMW